LGQVCTPTRAAPGLIAAKDPVSLRAHTDALQLWADQGVTIASVNDEIRIQAQTRIELVAGNSSLVLDGPDITFTTPGKFEVQASLHAFEGGGSQAASPPTLPDSRATVFSEQFIAKNPLTGAPVAGMPYRIELPDGEVVAGVTGDDGKTEVVCTTGPKALKLYWVPSAEVDLLVDAGADESC
jgi:type VI secretion system secreted protein VgrG